MMLSELNEGEFQFWRADLFRLGDVGFYVVRNVASTYLLRGRESACFVRCCFYEKQERDGSVECYAGGVRVF
jgi:hypothetical protein